VRRLDAAPVVGQLAARAQRAAHRQDFSVQRERSGSLADAAQVPATLVMLRARCSAVLSKHTQAVRGVVAGGGEFSEIARSFASR
jgi:hypothetical protein